jgi:hypothetical protein
MKAPDLPSLVSGYGRTLKAFQLGSLTLTIWAVGSAQSLIDPDQIANARKAFEGGATAKPLHCGISPVRPALNFSFRFCFAIWPHC